MIRDLSRPPLRNQIGWGIHNLGLRLLVSFKEDRRWGMFMLIVGFCLGMSGLLLLSQATWGYTFGIGLLNRLPKNLVVRVISALCVLVIGVLIMTIGDRKATSRR